MRSAMFKNCPNYSIKKNNIIYECLQGIAVYIIPSRLDQIGE